MSKTNINDMVFYLTCKDSEDSIINDFHVGYGNIISISLVNEEKIYTVKSLATEEESRGKFVFECLGDLMDFYRRKMMIAYDYLTGRDAICNLHQARALREARKKEDK